MAKVTSKLQVTIPKTIAERYAIAPGQEVEWLQAGDAIRVVPQSALRSALDASGRVELFDRATARQHACESMRGVERGVEGRRGWIREELMSATALVDTNVLVYRFDPRFPDKQKIATDVLRAGIADGSLRLPHQAVVELVAALTRPTTGGEPLLPRADALREAEELPDAVRGGLPRRGAPAARPARGSGLPGLRGSTRTCGPTRSASGWRSFSPRTSNTVASMARCGSPIHSLSHPHPHPRKRTTPQPTARTRAPDPPRPAATPRRRARTRERSAGGRGSRGHP